MTARPSAGELRVRNLVLIVDDESDIRFVTRLLLEGAGHEVVEAAEGGAALILLRHHDVDLVLTDVDMPGMGGLELLAEIRRDPGTAALPVLVWSERPQDVPGATASMTKGVGVQRLVAQVETILRGTDRWNV